MTATATSTRPVVALRDLRSQGYDMDSTKVIALLGILFARPRHEGAAADEAPACRHGADEGCHGATVYMPRHAADEDAEAVYAGCRSWR